jgi:ABC-2 type transport system ATP-binding protein
LEAIVTEGLSKYYGKLLALNSLNLKIETGRCVGFLGPNGAGKSTTIKILCSFIRPSSGKAYVNGFDAIREPVEALANVGALVETPEFYSYLTPSEVLGYLGGLRGMESNALAQRIREVMETVKLSDWLKVRIGKFSRGMKQRLGIAQSLLHNPPILLLDEPSLGLDPRGMAETREIIRDIVKQGKTIFLASHLLREVQEVCDSIALIDKGRLLAYDRLENLERLFKAAAISVELLQAPDVEVVKRIEGLESVSKVVAEGKSLKITFDGTDLEQADLLKALVTGLELQVVSFKPSVEALEEIYLQLVKEGN